MILLRHGQSEFNARFSATKIDPGIPDPGLTAIGRDQARAAGLALRDAGLTRIFASPYTRAIETARIVAEVLRLPIGIDPLVRERCAFSCDVGSPTSVLAATHAGIDFSHLPETWWHPELDETGEQVDVRAATFRARMIDHPECDQTLVVSHWGFILAMTGERVANGIHLRCDPTTPAPLVAWQF